MRQRTPDTEARQSILSAIDAADAPVTAATLGKLPGIGSGARVKPLLAENLASGRVFDWGKSKYWHLDPTKTARDQLLELAAREFLSRGQLAGRAVQASPGLNLNIVRSVLQKLVVEKRFRELSKPGAKTKGLLNVQHPEPYLEVKIASVLKSFGIERPAESIRAMLAPAQGAETPAPPPPRGPSPDAREVAEKIFAAMNRIALAPGATVTFYLLRKEPELAHIPKMIFDEAALLLQEERRALLSVHGYADRVPVEEREQLVTDGYGNHYVSIYAR
jgi:hypothetical protein